MRFLLRVLQKVNANSVLLVLKPLRHHHLRDDGDVVTSIHQHSGLNIERSIFRPPGLKQNNKLVLKLFQFQNYFNFKINAL